MMEGNESATQLPMFTAEEMSQCVRAAGPRPDWYVVLAHHIDGHWAYRGDWLNLDRALEVANDLPRCWTHYQIVLIPAFAMKGDAQ